MFILQCLEILETAVVSSLVTAALSRMLLECSTNSLGLAPLKCVELPCIGSHGSVL